MKIAVCSDLHLEFGDLDLQNTENADVLILSGDILVATDLTDFGYDESGLVVSASQSVRARAERFVNFINRCCERFPHVIYIAGNHEHYHGDFAKTFNILNGTFGDIKNLHILDKDYRIINGVLFYGGTLWTDMNGEDLNTMHRIQFMMNDYNGVKNSNKMTSYRTFLPDPENLGQEKVVFKERVSALTPMDTVEDHKAFLKGLKHTLEETQASTVVVCGHHAPSRASTHPRYKNDIIMNGAYSSSLDEFILDNQQIRLWTHGHTHEDFDYTIGKTRVVCNPRGYHNYEARADNFNLKYVEI